MTRFPLSIRSRFRLLTRSRCVALVGPQNTVFDTVSWPSSLLFVLGLKKARSRVLYAAPRSEQAAGYFKRHREVSKQPYTRSRSPSTLRCCEKRKQATGYFKRYREASKQTATLRCLDLTLCAHRNKEEQLYV